MALKKKEQLKEQLQLRSPKLLFGKIQIHIADHEIKIPSLYIKNMAEDVEVKLNAALEHYKQK